MDDLLLVGADIQVIESIKRKLIARFKMTDMGDVSLVLGMHVTRDRQNNTLTISQENYTKSILKTFRHGKLQAYQYSMLRIGSLHQTAGGRSSEQGSDGTKPLLAR